ncbi:MAG TPA: Gfo/Idh/MocA family oxidoreductase [Rhizobiaceae bacterium]|nr:Gfo/Idh/MocA family oxidoreductase [Rhizobiaceae bacterium]
MSLPKPRFGVIGTGAWARAVHMPAAAASSDVIFTSVFGRNAEALKIAASTHHIEAYQDLDAFLQSVEIVGIALPPELQPEFALAAAKARKHLLLEKPLALDLPTARKIEETLVANGLASVVFFPQLLSQDVGQWVAQTKATGGWFAASLERFSQALTDARNPFHASDWRLDAGALWDTAPHAVALLLAVFGEFAEVIAVRGQGDLVSLTLVTGAGAIATLTLARDAMTPLPGKTMLFGSSGMKELPPTGNWNSLSIEAYQTALCSLSAAANGTLQKSLLYDARFAVQVTAVLAAAEASLKERIVRIGPALA